MFFLGVRICACVTLVGFSSFLFSHFGWVSTPPNRNGVGRAGGKEEGKEGGWRAMQ